MRDLRRTCYLIISITGFAMSVAAGWVAGRMALLGNWLSSSITLCAAAWLLSVSETAFDRLFRRRSGR